MLKNFSKFNSLILQSFFFPLIFFLYFARSVSLLPEELVDLEVVRTRRIRCEEPEEKVKKLNIPLPLREKVFALAVLINIVVTLVFVIHF